MAPEVLAAPAVPAAPRVRVARVLVPKAPAVKTHHAPRDSERKVRAAKVDVRIADVAMAPAASSPELRVLVRKADAVRVRVEKAPALRDSERKVDAARGSVNVAGRRPCRWTA